MSIWDEYRDADLTPQELSEMMTAGGGFETSGTMAGLLGQFLSGEEAELTGGFLPYAPSMLSGFDFDQGSWYKGRGGGPISEDPSQDEFSAELAAFWAEEQSIFASDWSEEYLEGLEAGDIDYMPWAEESDYWDETTDFHRWGKNYEESYDPFSEYQLAAGMYGYAHEIGMDLSDLFGTQDWLDPEDIDQLYEYYAENTPEPEDIDTFKSWYFQHGEELLVEYEDIFAEHSAVQDQSDNLGGGSYRRLSELFDASNFLMTGEESGGSYDRWLDDYGYYIEPYDPTKEQLLGREYSKGVQGLSTKYLTESMPELEAQIGGAGFASSYITESAPNVFEEIAGSQKALFSNLKGQKGALYEDFESGFYSDLSRMANADVFSHVSGGDFEHVWMGPTYQSGSSYFGWGTPGEQNYFEGGSYSALDAFLHDWALEDGQFRLRDWEEAHEGMLSGLTGDLDDT